ncbi:MAG: FmdB family zinc ribbon protein [Planctomycetota bacterium]
MPTYDYVCQACGHRFEEFHSMTRKPLRKCPECSKNALERLIGAGAGVIFKGSGFYQTDYKNTGGGKESGKSGDDAPKSDSGAGGGCGSPVCGTDAAPPTCQGKTGKKGK